MVFAVVARVWGCQHQIFPRRVWAAGYHRRCTNSMGNQIYDFENKVVKLSYQTKRLKKQRIVQQKLGFRGLN